MLRTSNLHSIYGALKQVYRTSSIVTPAISSEKHGTSEDNNNNSSSEEEKCKSRMVAAVFASLKNPSEISLDERIYNSKTPEELLTLSQNSLLSRKQALKIVTTLTEWSVNGLADMPKFETDPRFVSVCQLLGRSSSGNQQNIKSITKQTLKVKHGDLSVIHDVTASDEAVKLVSTLTIPQMIKTLTKLSAKKQRPLPLLRSLVCNIANSSVKLGVKDGADTLFALSQLNFPDKAILEKICNDLIEVIPLCEKSAVIGSISTSFGRLRYRNDSVLDCLNKWALDNKSLCRNQELVSILITHAIVNHTPVMGNEFFDLIGAVITENDLPSASAWLDIVWALEVFGKTTNDHYRSVLSQRFIQRMLTSNYENSNVTWKKKLLNLNGAAKLDKNYKGPNLEGNKEINIIPMVRTRDKQLLVNSILDGLSNILPSPSYLRNNIDTGMGFLIDAECRLDSKMTPFPLVDKKTGQPIIHKAGKGLRIAVMCWDYHDNTRGRIDLNGSNALTINLLTKAGYRVLSILFNEYNMNDKLSDRIRFLEDELKKTVRPSG